MSASIVLRASDRLPWAAFSAIVALIVVACWPTFAQLAQTWRGDVSFQHGWFVPPIAGYLVWRQRARLCGLQVRPSWGALLVLLGAAGVWLVAHLIDLRLFAQYAVVGMVITAVVAVFGAEFARHVAFPLGYLLLAVPVGESLIPILMQFTADFAVGALHWSGIPVYRSGLYFVTPTGTFEVTKSCSGIRYLMASVAISALLAYLMFRSWRRRALLVAFAIIIAVLGNALRAYLIVVIAHFSDMSLAAGVDHFVYGWLMFALLMMVVYWFALRLREPQRERPVATLEGSPHVDASSRNTVFAVAAVAASVLVSAAVTANAARAAGPPATPPYVPPMLPSAQAGWLGPELQGGGWRPSYGGARGVVKGRYSRGATQVSVFVASYGGGRWLAGDMVGSGRGVLVDEQAPVRLERRAVHLSGGEHTVAATLLGEADLHTTRAVWLWYEVGERVTTSAVSVKFLEAVGFLRRRVEPQRVFVLSAASYGDDGDAAERALRSFLDDHVAALRRCAVGADRRDMRCVGVR